MCYDERFYSKSVHSPLVFDSQMRYNNAMEIYRMTENRICHDTQYHIVWCSKFRRPVLTEPMRIRVKELITEISKAKDIVIENLEVGPFYVYLKAEIPPVESVNSIVHYMKYQTGGVLRKEFPSLRSRIPCMWTLHFFVSTRPEVPREDIAAWIKTQPRCNKKGKIKCETM